jgi:hypothetical protein
VSARASLATSFFDAARPNNNPYGGIEMTKTTRRNSANPLRKRTLQIAALAIALVAVGITTWAITDNKNEQHTVSTNTPVRTCEQWRGGAELPLKLSSTDPSQFAGQELQNYLKGGYSYVYYFVADGSQKDAIGKSYPTGKVVFSAPSYFTKDTAYTDHVKPALDEISKGNGTDAKQYLAGNNFKNIVLNAVNSYNQSHHKSIDELCAKFTD